MVKAPSHGGKLPPPAPLIVQGRAVSVASVRRGGSRRTTLTTSSSSSADGIRTGANTTGNKKPAGNLPRTQPQPQQQARRHPSLASEQRWSVSGRGRPRPYQNGASSRSNGTSKSSSIGSSGAPMSTTSSTQTRPQRKAPPTHLLTYIRTSVPVSEEAQRQQQRLQNQKRRNRHSNTSSNNNESSRKACADDNGFEALTWNSFQGDDGVPTQDFWPGGSTQAGLTSSVKSVDNNPSRQVSMATIPTISSTTTTSDAPLVVTSAVERGVHIPGGGSNKSKLLGGSIRSTGKTTRKLAGILGSKLTSVGAKARGLKQMGDDAFYGTGEAGFSTNIRTIKEEELYGAAAAPSSITFSTISGGTTVSMTHRAPPENSNTALQHQQGQLQPSPRSLEGHGQTAANRGLIPTAFARLAPIQSLSTTGGTTVQAIPVAASTPTASMVSATSVVATTTTLRPPVPVVIGGKVVVKGMAINRSFAGDLEKIEMTVHKYKRIRTDASGGSRQGPRAASQSNSQLAESIAELRACLPKLEALVNRTMLSRTTDANALERLLSLNDELRLILAHLKGEGIKRHAVQGVPTARSSQLPTTQQARDQSLFKKMREDSDKITAPVVVAKTIHSANGAGGASGNQEPLFHDDPFHGFPEFNNFDDDFETDDSHDSTNDAGLVDEEDRNGMSRLEDEVARLEKQLSGLDPLAQLAMDTALDDQISHVSNSSATFDGDASIITGFADMEREMMKQLAMGNAWMAREAVDDKPKVMRVSFSQDVTVFEIPNRHQARLVER